MKNDFIKPNQSSIFGHYIQTHTFKQRFRTLRQQIAIKHFHELFKNSTKRSVAIHTQKTVMGLDRTKMCVFVFQVNLSNDRFAF